MNKNLIAAILIVAAAIAAYVFINTGDSNKVTTSGGDIVTEGTPADTPKVDTAPDEMMQDTDETKTIIGQSVNGEDITAYHYGTGDTELLFIGGIHGGYEWNTALVAYEMIDMLEKDAGIVPSNVKVTIIPVLNPDGLKLAVGSAGRFNASDAPVYTSSKAIAGRFNANEVDLNRNFACDWKEDGIWQNKKVSGGSSAFSEPEAQAIQTYVNAHSIAAAVVWYSAANGVYSSSCGGSISSETKTLTKIYADASTYPAYEEFDSYAITGDMVNWFAKENIPAISVLLATHSSTEWSKNEAGIEAVLKHYSK